MSIPAIAQRAATIFLLAATLLLPGLAAAQSAGLIEYFVPGPEEQLREIFEDMDNDPPVGDYMEAIITVAAATDSTTLYYDHWENGYDFDPDNPSSADEIWLLNAGQHETFTGTAIFANPRNSAEVYYDGGDRIYTIGGPVTLTRTSWSTAMGTLYALAWEVYPNKLLNEDYVIPIGENLNYGPLGYTDFENTYVILQAMRDDTHIIVDDPFVGGVEIDSTLSLGGYTQLYHINAGTEIHASRPVQVQFVVGRTWGGINSECRGFSAVPTAAWGQSYYCPVTSWETGFHSDLYCYNPNPFSITINWEGLNDDGFFTLDGNETRSLYDITGEFLPTNSATHIWSDEVFWGVGAGGTRNGAFDWGFGLVPEEYLTPSYHLGWAPSTWDKSADGSPVFVTPVRDSTTVWVDWSPADGTPDQSWQLERLEVIKINDPDHDNSGLHIWGTDKLAVIWGEDAGIALYGENYLDVGYAALSIPDPWMELVLRVECETTPASLPGDGGSSQLQVEVSSFAWAVDNPQIISYLPSGWDYIPGTTTITLPDNSTISGPAADPLIVGEELRWQPLAGFQPEQTLQLEYSVQTNGEQQEGQNEFRLEARGHWEDTHVFSAYANSWVFIASADSRIKPLYLRADGGNTLQRVPPSGGHSDIWIPEGGSANWLLAPALTDTLHISGDINIPLYLYRSNELYSPDVEIELIADDGFALVIGSDLISDITSGFYTFVVPAVDLTLPPGATLELTVTTTEIGPGDRSVHLRYDGEEYQSRVVLATDTYLVVASFGAYDGPWPTGQLASVFYSDDPIWFTVEATDPFGYADITSSSLGVPPVIASLPLAVIEEAENRRVFSGTTSIAEPGVYTAVDTTREGWEGTVEILRDFTLTIIKTDLHSTLTVEDLNAGPLEPGDTLRFDGYLYNSGNADATDVRNDLLLPTQLQFLGGNSTQGALQLAGDTLRLEVGTIPLASDTILYTFLGALDTVMDNNTLLTLQALLTDAEGDQILSDNPAPNQWSGQESGNDPADPADDDPLGLIILSATLIELTCAATDLDGTPTAPGDSVAYLIQLTNSGNQHLDDPAGILYAQPLPPFTLYREGSGFCSSGVHWWSDDSLFWQGTVAVGEEIELSFAVDLETPLYNGTEIVTQALVGYDAAGTDSLSAVAYSDDPATPEPLDDTRLIVTSAPALYAGLTVLDENGMPAVPGDTLTWEFVIQNSGNAASADNPGPEAVLPLPAWSLFHDWSVDHGLLELEADTLRFNGELAPSQPVTINCRTVLADQIPNQTPIYIQGVVYYDSTSVFSNDWQLLSDNPQTPAPADPTGVIITSAPTLYAALTVADPNGTPTEPGDTLSWQLTVYNFGDDTSPDNPGPEAKLPLPAWNSFQSWSSNSGDLTLVGDTLLFNGQYTAGDEVVITVETLLDQMIPNEALAEMQGIVLYDSTGGDSNDWLLFSDDPATPEPADPTAITISSTLQLSALLTVAEAPALLTRDTKRGAISPAGFDTWREEEYYPGTRLRWEMVIANEGNTPPTGLEWTLELPAELAELGDLEFPPGAVNLTDTTGGSWGTGLLRFQLDSLDYQSDALFAFQTTVDSLAAHDLLVSCQAELACDQLLEPMSSDSDPDSAGAQPTEFRVQRPLLQCEAQLASTGGTELMPGDTLTLTLSWINHSTLTLSQIDYREAIHPELPWLQITELPPGAVDNSTDSGGQWGAGEIRIDDLQAAPGDTVTCRWQLVAASVAEDTNVELQGGITAAIDTLFTDADPLTPGAQPLTVEILSQRDIFASLLVEIDNPRGGGFGSRFSHKQLPEVLALEAAPGDRLLWTFQLENYGTDLSWGVSMYVDLPAWLMNTTLEEHSELLEVNYGPDGGVYDNGWFLAVADSAGTQDTLTFSFSTVIHPTIPDSTLLVTQGSVLCATIVDTLFTDGDLVEPGLQSTEVLVLTPGGELSGTLLFTDLNGGHIHSGDTLRFCSLWENSYPYAIEDFTYRHDMPPYTRLSHTGYLPAGVQDTLAWEGGASERGFIQVDSLTLAGSASDSLEYWLVVDSLLTFSVIDTTQAMLQLGVQTWLTDGDPTAPGIQPTVFHLQGDGAPEQMTLSLSRNDPDLPFPGGTTSYDLRLDNLSGSILSGCMIALPLPAWVTAVEITEQPQGSTDISEEDQVAVNDFVLGPDGFTTLSVALQLSTELLPDALITLQGWSGCLQIPGPVFSNQLTDTLRAAPRALTLELSGFSGGALIPNNGTVQVQDSLLYLFTLTNSGGAPLTGITISDTLDSALRFASAVCGQGPGDYSNGILTFSNINLDVDAMLSGTIVVDIIDPLPLGTVISSRLTAEADTITVSSDADPQEPGDQPLVYLVDFELRSPLLIWNNPCRTHGVDIVYHAPGAERVSLAVYNVLGERVRWFADLPPGEGVPLLWHSDNDSGQSLANGTYILVLKVDGKLTREKIALIR